jgi:hypothetical protein
VYVSYETPLHLEKKRRVTTFVFVQPMTDGFDHSADNYLITVRSASAFPHFGCLPSTTVWLCFSSYEQKKTGD